MVRFILMTPFKNTATSIHLIPIETMQDTGQPSGQKVNIFLLLSLISVIYPKSLILQIRQNEVQRSFGVSVLRGKRNRNIKVTCHLVQSSCHYILWIQACRPSRPFYFSAEWKPIQLLTPLYLQFLPSRVS